MLSNVNLESLALRLRPEHDVYVPGGYDVWIQKLLDVDSGFYKFNPEDCFIIIDAKGNFEGETAENAIVKAAKILTRCNFYISTLDAPTHLILPLKESLILDKARFEWYLILSEMVSGYGNIYPLNLSILLERRGSEQLYSAKMWYLSGIPFSAYGEKVLSAMILNIVKTRRTARKKCLILDLDNTLWGGVIGEDGIGGIELDITREGARYRDFQKNILAIKNTGVLLAISSKNNIEDVEIAFKHPYMLLKPEDFVIKKINWRSKSQNIAEIATELNISVDSLVFIDDNPAERAEVRAMLPDVAVPEFPQDTCKLEEFTANLFADYFFILDLSDEDTNKHRMYAENIAREGSKSGFENASDYLEDLNITLKMEKVTETTLHRAFQMVQKTNQFNLTTIRYSEMGLQEIMKNSDYLIVIGQAADRFGDNGHCLLMVCKKLDCKTAEIESFLMSCRVMGRTVERAALIYLEDVLKTEGIEIVRSSYIFTNKNSPVREFYDSMGYTLTNEDKSGDKYYMRAILDTREEEKNCFVTVV